MKVWESIFIILPPKSNSDLCSAICMGKVHGLPSHAYNSIYAAPFDLIFADVGRLTPILSSCGYKYMLTCVNACRKFTWVYFLKLKSEVSTTFKNFHAMIDKQFNITIKSVHTDGGGEFILSFLSLLQMELFIDSHVPTHIIKMV